MTIKSIKGGDVHCVWMVWAKINTTILPKHVVRALGSERFGVVTMTSGRTLLWLAVACVAVLAACGGDNPTEPSSRYPQVAGTYTGPATITAHAVGETATGSGRAVVVQSGNQVTVTGWLTFDGEEFVLPAATGTINETGFFTLTASGDVPSLPVATECGFFTLTSSSLTFAGRNLMFEESYQSTLCGAFSLAATLTRQ